MTEAADGISGPRSTESRNFCRFPNGKPRARSIGLTGWFGNCGSRPSCRTSVADRLRRQGRGPPLDGTGQPQEFPTPPAFRLRPGSPRFAARQQSDNRILS